MGRDFDDVIRGATKNGAIDLMEIQKGEGSCGYNGGTGCDVFTGPCSCGAWHTLEENREVKFKNGELTR